MKLHYLMFPIGLVMGFVGGGCFDPKAENCATGTEGCRCTVGGSCDGDLMCMSDICVALGGTDTSGEPGDGDPGDGDPGDGDGDPGDGDGSPGDGDGDPGDGDGDDPTAMCGNGQIEGDEQCDGDQLAGATCVILGYSGGTLACNRMTCTYDASGCISSGWDPDSCQMPSQVIMVGNLPGSFCSAPCSMDPDCPPGPMGTQASCALTIMQGEDPSFCALVCQPANDTCPAGSSCKDLMDPQNPGLGLCTFP